MKKLALATLLSLSAAPVFAEPACTPGEAVKPVWESMKAFEEAGGKVVSFKINDGACYEIYGTSTARTTRCSTTRTPAWKWNASKPDPKSQGGAPMTISITPHPHRSRAAKVRVWDIGVRLFHWSLVASVAATYLLTDSRVLHRRLGYVVVGLIAFRLIWGLVGTHHARFASFVPGPRKFLRYLAAMWAMAERRATLATTPPGPR